MDSLEVAIEYAEQQELYETGATQEYPNVSRGTLPTEPGTNGEKVMNSCFDQLQSIFSFSASSVFINNRPLQPEAMRILLLAITKLNQLHAWGHLFSKPDKDDPCTALHMLARSSLPPTNRCVWNVVYVKDWVHSHRQNIWLTNGFRDTLCSNKAALLVTAARTETATSKLRPAWHHPGLFLYTWQPRNLCKSLSKARAINMSPYICTCIYIYICVCAIHNTCV